MNRSTINLTLLGLVAILAAIVWLSPADNHSGALSPLTPFTPNDITHIQRSTRHGPPLRLLRQGAGWGMTEPHALAADGERVERLLGILTAPVLERFPVPSDRLSEFGLDPPLTRLELNGTELVFGGTDPINHRRYVRLANDLLLIKDIYAHHLLAPAEAFVSPRLLPGAEKIRSLRTPDWQLSRGPGGNWELTPPAPGLSPDRLVAKIDAWLQARAVKIEAAHAEASRIVEILLEGDGDPLRFAILDRPEGMLLVRQGFDLGYRLPSGSDLLALPGKEKP